MYSMSASWHTAT